MRKLQPHPPTDDETVTTALDSNPIASARARGKPFVLEQVEGPGAPRRYFLELEEIVIGRSRDAHIPIASKSISRKHVMLKRSGPEYICSDMNSSNGVFLNGIKAFSAVLRDGDAVQIGDVVFVYHEGS